MESSDSLSFRFKMLSNSKSTHELHTSCVKSFTIKPDINFDIHLNPNLSLRGNKLLDSCLSLAQTSSSRSRNQQRTSIVRHFSELKRTKSPFTFIETVSIQRHSSLSPSKKVSFRPTFNATP
jgi:hypothetical protein